MYPIAQRLREAVRRLCVGCRVVRSRSWIGSLDPCRAQEDARINGLMRPPDGLEVQSGGLDDGRGHADTEALRIVNTAAPQPIHHVPIRDELRHRRTLCRVVQVTRQNRRTHVATGLARDESASDGLLSRSAPSDRRFGAYARVETPAVLNSTCALDLDEFVEEVDYERRVRLRTAFVRHCRYSGGR
jgi:hypothetical protein